MDFIKRVFDEQLHYGEKDDYYIMEKFDDKDPKEVASYEKSGKQPSKELRKGRVRRANMFYTSYVFDTIYQEMGEDEELMGFQKDQDKDKLLLLIRFGAKRSSENITPRKFIIKVYDEILMKVECSVWVTDPHIIGIMLSGQLRLLDGHIYHQNQLIKVRYDLIGKIQNIDETKLFDRFEENLPLRTGMQIASDAILVCELRHRMAFIAEDSQCNRCSIVRLMPFLHERRLYFDVDTPGKYLIASMQLNT